MIEIDYTVEIAAPIDEVWTYLWNIPNWAHLMIGFQTVKVVDEQHSVWTLKGDVGVLSREVDLEVIIDEWEPRSFLNFTVNGLTEQIAGSGTFEIGEVPDDSAPARPLRPGRAAPRPLRRGRTHPGRRVVAPATQPALGGVRVQSDHRDRREDRPVGVLGTRRSALRTPLPRVRPGVARGPGSPSTSK